MLWSTAECIHTPNDIPYDLCAFTSTVDHVSESLEKLIFSGIKDRYGINDKLLYHV